MVNSMCLLWDNSSFWVCTRSHTPPNGSFSHVLGYITSFTTFQCEEHIPSAPKSGPSIHPLHIKLRLYHLIGTLYMLGWVRMLESGVVQVASTTGHDLKSINKNNHSISVTIDNLSDKLKISVLLINREGNVYLVEFSHLGNILWGCVGMTWLIDCTAIN